MQAYADQLCDEYIKKALILSAFFIVISLSILSASPAFAKNCISPKLGPPEKARVKWVYDGDTLLLEDKRKIRVIGIDTPEVKHHKQKAQAYGAKAREALRELLKRFDYHVFLRFGAEKQDKYSRYLAHVYLPDGTNISNWLLDRGYAKTMAIPPNITLAKCYKVAEKAAQNQSLKIWRYKINKIKTSKTLAKSFSGYIRLKAKVEQVKHYKKSIVIMLNGYSKRSLRVKIKKKNLKYFKSLKLDKLINKTILVTGTLRNRYGTRTIYVNYPTQITILQSIKGDRGDEGKRLRAEGAKTNRAVIKWSLKNEH